MLRTLLRIPSRVGRPGTLLTLGDAGGSVTYLQVAMGPVSVVAGLDYDDVAQLHEALSLRLRQLDDLDAVRAHVPSPRIPGLLGRLVADANASGAAAAAAGTVQLCTEPATS